ncbi:MAG: C45 family autoproteolytic acyltransferase/hydrolase [Phocaeicola sp.]
MMIQKRYKKEGKGRALLLKGVKVFLALVLVLLLVPIVVFVVLYQRADMGEPVLTVHPTEYQISGESDSLYCQGSYLKKNRFGLWELYVEGSGQVRGAKQGALTAQLMKYQEDVFINQIREIVPSDWYLGLLRRFIIIFNRNMGKHIPLEYRNEIAAMSQFCTDEYNAIGTPYERQLNYHAAHDIGHTMQQYMLVGCSSFGVWGDKSETHSLLVGRNFDFYVGDDFAKNKLMTFAVPDEGYRYASIGWAGMVGVLSGMNQCGLTVTINAAKGAIPTSAATPISILTREILQYASTIEEAYHIAQSRETFVSESILIGSAADSCCAIIEKSPTQTALYRANGELIVCTNHFQSADFQLDEYNVENLATSDSRYRYERLSQLLDLSPQIDYREGAAILRNRLGMDGEEIGIGNEMTLNQSIAHHSVLFMPHEQRMWVSTSPWQSGELLCYDLSGFFSKNELPVAAPAYNIAADSTFLLADYPLLKSYRAGIQKIKSAMKSKEKLSEAYVDSFRLFNPHHYYTHRILGDYYRLEGENEKAATMYKAALNCSIPYRSERVEIEQRLKE